MHARHEQFRALDEFATDLTTRVEAAKQKSLEIADTMLDINTIIEGERQIGCTRDTNSFARWTSLPPISPLASRPPNKRVWKLPIRCWTSTPLLKANVRSDARETRTVSRVGRVCHRSHHSRRGRQTKEFGNCRYDVGHQHHY